MRGKERFSAPGNVALMPHTSNIMNRKTEVTRRTMVYLACRAHCWHSFVDVDINVNIAPY
jgi:hypothetical protein